VDGLGENRNRPTSRPSRVSAVAVCRVADQRQAIGIDSGDTPNLLTTPVSSSVTRLRRFN
jgi:hypothetical protein